MTCCRTEKLMPFSHAICTWWWCRMVVVTNILVETEVIKMILSKCCKNCVKKSFLHSFQYTFQQLVSGLYNYVVRTIYTFQNIRVTSYIGPVVGACPPWTDSSVECSNGQHWFARGRI